MIPAVTLASTLSVVHGCKKESKISTPLQTEATSHRRKTRQLLALKVKKSKKYHPRQIRFVGDSIMAGANTTLRYLKRGVRNDQASNYNKPGRSLVIGSSSEKIIKRAIAALQDPKIKAIVLNGGINDLYDNPKMSRQQVTKAILEAYERILRVATIEQKRVIIMKLIEPTRYRRIGYSHQKILEAIEYINDQLKNWSDTGEIDGRKLYLSLVKLDSSQKRFMSRDGLHPNWRGAQHLARQIIKQVIK